jgi:hypothetical protein
MIWIDIDSYYKKIKENNYDEPVEISLVNYSDVEIH